MDISSYPTVFDRSLKLKVLDGALLGPDGKPILGADGLPIVLGEDGKPVAVAQDGPFKGAKLGPDGKLGCSRNCTMIFKDFELFPFFNFKPYCFLKKLSCVCEKMSSWTPYEKPILGPNGCLLGADGKPLVGPNGELLGADGKPLLGPNGELLGADGKPLTGPNGCVLGPDGKPLVGPNGELLGADGKPILGADGKPIGADGQSLRDELEGITDEIQAQEGSSLGANFDVDVEEAMR